jgi:D-alanine-D-alanine ligase
MKNKTVGVFFGSRSAEHDVSIVTAISAIIKPLKVAGYTVVPVYIAKDGRWYSDEKLADIALFSSGKITDFIAKSKPVGVIFDNGLVLQAGGISGKKTRIDIAFPATHGTHGEDGHLMGVFEMANVPYVGCDVAASTIAMDKVLSKQVAKTNDIPTPETVYFFEADYKKYQQDILQRIEKNLKMPLFVKPAHLGSSIGISKVQDNNELVNAIEVAFHYDNKVLVEEAVPNLIEVTLPIMGNSELTPALLEQPLSKSADFFDFDTKYISEGGKKGGKGKRGAQGYSKLPADIPKDLYDESVEVALGVYKSFGCSGIARVDLLIDEKAKKVYFNEINPLPGSLYIHNWRAAGVSNVALVEKLLALALEKHESTKDKTTVFETNFLKQF